MKKNSTDNLKEMVAEVTEDVLFIRNSTIYFDYTDENLKDCLNANQGNVVGQSMDVQIRARKALKRLEAMTKAIEFTEAHPPHQAAPSARQAHSRTSK